VVDGGPVGTEPQRGHAPERRAEQREDETGPRIDQDGDREDHAGPEVVLEEYLSDPAKQGVSEIGRRQPDSSAAAGGRLQAGLDRGAPVHTHRVDELRRAQLPELVEGEQQQPGRHDERGRSAVPCPGR
jgi:hypothetical protein